VEKKVSKRISEKKIGYSKDFIKEECDNIDQTLRLYLVNSMKKRIESEMAILFNTKILYIKNLVLTYTFFKF